MYVCVHGVGVNREDSDGEVPALEASRGSGRTHPLPLLLRTFPHYGLFKIRGQGPWVRQPVPSECVCVGGDEIPGTQARREQVEGAIQKLKGPSPPIPGAGESCALWGW